MTAHISAGVCRVCNVGCRMYIRCQTAKTNACIPWLWNVGRRNAFTKSGETDCVKHLRRCIQTTGPLTIAEYMREVLINPITGYYMSKDVFGTKGDFITSPEISQMFGELIALWVIHEWTQLGQTAPLQVVELGPGRGTLAEDMLRVFKQFQHITGNSLSLHLVEVSPKMSQLQEEKLTGRHQSSNETDNPEAGQNSATGRSDREGKSLSPSAYKTGISKTGVPVSWYQSLREVPKGMSCFIAHEFFDALPIHKFQKTDKGWREVLVDIDSDVANPHHLRFVLSPAPTPASTVYPKPSDSRDHIEVCPEGGAIVQEMASRISQHGGMSLIIDYGHDGTKTDTLRGFRKHQLHDVLCEPGTADLTADVDFSYFCHVVQGKVSTHGPISQGTFLKAMGIETRLKMLLKTASDEQSNGLITGYRMLTDPAQMGERFKFFAMMPQTTQHRIPAGFPC